LAGDYLAHLQAAAESALASLRRHAVPPTALNYAVWFTHHAGQNPALSKTIRELEAKGEPFDEVRHLELVERFLGRTAQLERIQELVGKADGALEAIAGELGGFRADTAAYGATLEGAATTLERSGRSDGIARLVAELQAATAAMRARAEALEQELGRRDAELAALRVDLAKAEDAMSSDPLTGIGNRRRFDRALEKLAREAIEQGAPLSLLMVDIDHFKRFNDTWGHPVGDLVLKLVAAKLAEKALPPRIAARYGGEEFALLLPATDLGSACELAERIRSEVGDREVVLKSDGRRLGTVTLSIGAARFRPGEPLDRFLARADAALYRAKASGRNRVEREAD
jgi:diguanylate cyclase